MNLATLILGLGVGTVLGWWFGRSQNSALDKSALDKSVDSASPIVSPERPIAAAKTSEPSHLAYQMAIEMAQFKAGFLGRSSHELRSPINTVISLHQLILSDLCESPEEEREFVAQAKAAAEKMLGLLDRLILLSKTSYGTEPPQLQPLPLAETIAEVEQFIQLQAKNRNLRLTVEQPNPEVCVLADPRWLRQALLHLLDTSIGSMQEGSIRLTTHTADGTALIWIEDQRPAEFWSEPIDFLDRLKAGQALEPALFPSAGLNLLIVKAMLELMGGRLSVLATPDETSDLSRIEMTLAIADGAE